jgi:tellurite methyltransferase
MSYDEVYGKSDHVFGEKHETLLQKFLPMLSRERPVLDIGVGQGRNALYLARHGFEVHGIDPSKVAVDTVAALASKGSLPIEVRQCDFETYVPLADCYSAVLIFGLIQILPWQGIHRLVSRIGEWTASGGLVFVTGFLFSDASYLRYVQEGERLGKHSFVMPPGDVRTFLEPEEILRVFSDFIPLHHWEGMGPYHRHGKGPRERHARVEAVFQIA